MKVGNFRGMRKDNKEWIYGDICHHDGKISYIGQDPADGSMIVIDLIPETVGRNTELTDKNENPIFEGDILKGCYNPHKIIFNDYCAAFQLMSSDGFSDFFLCSINHKEMTVIGNIHENPELMHL